MAGGSSKSNPPRPRKRVDAETNNTLKRARDGSAFTRCEECKKDVPVALIDMHSCSLDTRIKMHLESQVVEMVSEPKKPPQKKRPAPSEKSAKKGGSKKRKADRDPKMPKRPPTAFFVFMAEFREQLKEANPNSKRAAAASKEGGDKWKSMSEEEKKPYLDKAAELKVEYEKAMEEYKASGNDDDDEVEEVEGPESGKEEDGKEEEGCDKEGEEAKEEGNKELEDDVKDEPEKGRVGRRVVLDDDDED